MRVAVGCDHGGLAVKEAALEVLAQRGCAIADFGVMNRESVDYSDYALEVVESIVDGRNQLGILVCTTGIGMSIAANRFVGVRAALCSSVAQAVQTRTHNNANVLVLAGTIDGELAKELVTEFLRTPFSGEERHVRRLEKIERARRMGEVSHLAGADPEVHRAVVGQIAQEDTTINLIASENNVTRAVREASGSVLTNKYAEGYPGRRWYSGCEPVDSVESLAIERAKRLFGAEHVNVQPHCGSAANMGVYFAVLKPGDTILSMSLDQGGHLTHGSPVNFSGQLYNIVPYRVSPESEQLDYAEIERLAQQHKPRMIVAGASAYPRVLDFPRFRAIADACGALLLVDMAHIAGLVAGGVHPSPVPYAEFVTTTTHKTLRGPRGGMILCREEFAKAIDKTVFPGLQGGPLENIIAAKAVCFKEALAPDFKEYARQIVANSRALAATLMQRGFHLVSGGTDNHLMLVNVARSGLTGKDAAAALDAAGIICNKNSIPFDSHSPFVTSGIRIGTAAVTTRGMKEPEMERIGAWIAEVLGAASDAALQAQVRQQVAQFARQFLVP